jgi:hypothetical protein
MQQGSDIARVLPGYNSRREITGNQQGVKRESTGSQRYHFNGLVQGLVITGRCGNAYPLRRTITTVEITPSTDEHHSNYFSFCVRK